MALDLRNVSKSQENKRIITKADPGMMQMLELAEKSPSVLHCCLCLNPVVSKSRRPGNTAYRTQTPAYNTEQNMHEEESEDRLSQDWHRNHIE